MSHHEEDFWGQAKPAPQKEQKSQSRAKTIYIILALVAIFAIFSLVGFKLANHWLGGPGIANPPEEENPAVVVPEKDKRMNILLLGIDQRANEPARSDTIILVFLNQKTKDIKLLSVPRDTYAKIPGRQYEKIGHANAYGGPRLAVQAVEDLLDVEIHRYIEINFEGFKNVVDTLGGIEMEVEKRMYYPPEDIDLYPGLQRLNGHDALAYVRYRSDADDLVRIKRQQKFIKEFAEEIFQLGTIFKLPGLIKDLNQSVNTDLTTGEMLSLATSAKALNIHDMETATLPGKPREIKKLSYWVHDEEETKKLIDRFLNPPEPIEEDIDEEEDGEKADKVID